MPRFAPLYRLAAPAVAALVLAAGLVGCDFQRYDHGADMPTARHLEALASADSRDAAEAAIRSAMNKVGVDWTEQGLARGEGYASYTLPAEVLRSVAAEQAAYARGEHAGYTLREGYQRVIEAQNAARAISDTYVDVTPVPRDPVRVSGEEAAVYLRAALAAAGGDPEHRESALLFLLYGAAVEPGAPVEIDLDRRLSPAQQLFFSMWLHRNGPLMIPMADLPTSPTDDYEGLAPTGDVMAGGVDVRLGGGKKPKVCCGASESKFTSITLFYWGLPGNVSARVVVPPPKSYQALPSTPMPFGTVFTVSGAGRPHGGGFAGTIGNELQLSVNGSNLSAERIHTSCSVSVRPGDVYGRFIVLGVTTASGGVCSNLEVCTAACDAQLLACLSCATTDGQRQACHQQFRECDLNCHDQGGGN